jgi:hypothetical protein
LGISTDLKFYELVRILGNALAKSIALTGWPVKKQELIKFEPQKWSSNYITQSCDILANFFFNFLRFHTGLKDEKYKLKAEAISKHFLIKDLVPEIQKSFDLSEGETKDVICTNQEFLVTIDPIL